MSWIDREWDMGLAREESDGSLCLFEASQKHALCCADDRTQTEAEASREPEANGLSGVVV